MAVEIHSSEDARKVLSAPLRFGDPDQISARRYLEDLALALDLIPRCEHPDCRWCKGTGVHLHSGDVCVFCRGMGAERCDCFDQLSFPDSVVIEAREELDRRREKKLRAYFASVSGGR